jgi:hypothetical protein
MAMEFSDETVMAYADGELDAATRATLEAALPHDAHLAQRVARQHALRVRLKDAFDPVLDEPLPERLLAAARGAVPARAAGNVVPLRRAVPARWSWPQWAALAASLVLGVVLSPWLGRAPGGAPLVTHDGALQAGGALARALSEQLAATQSTTAPVQIGVSFRARSGAFCRSFVLRDKSALAGVACREHDAWQLQVLAAAAGPQGATYQPAASSLPPAVAGAVDELIEGEALDARGEAAARAQGWSR